MRDIKYFKDLLNNLLNELTQDLQYLKENVLYQSMYEKISTSPPTEEYSSEMFDFASESNQRETSFCTAENISNKIKKLNAALERIKSGNYGICLNCGLEIDIKRLMAIPETEFCIKCVDKH